MADYSYIFDFQRVDDFFDRWNVGWSTSSDFGFSNKFQIVLCSYAPNNITQCLSNGVIDTNAVTVHSTQDCTLDWIDEEIILASNVTFNLSTDIVPCKALFIRKKSNNIVLGYCINVTPFEITNQLKFSKDTILWSIKDGE